MLFNLKYGYICRVRPGEVQVQLKDENIPTDWLPVLRRRTKTDKESWPMEINEHVVCLLDAKCNEGVCLGAIHSDKDKSDTEEAPGKFRIMFEDGTVIEYNKKEATLTADIKGKLLAKVTGDAEIQAGQDLKGSAQRKVIIQAPNIEITGNLKITGPVNIDGSLIVTGSVKGNGVDLKNHIHTNGNNGANTGTAI